MSAKSEALDQARRGLKDLADALLPMDKASRMKRAKEMGFQPDYFHETTRDNEQALLSGGKGFDLERIGASKSDTDVPRGVFLKQTGKPIGVVQEDPAAQMMLMANPGNQLKVIDRQGLIKHLSFTSPEWRELNLAQEKFDRRLGKKFDDFDKRYTESKSDAEYDEILNEESEFIKEAKKKQRDYAEKMQAVAARELKNQGYNSVSIARDQGSFGREIGTTIMLDPKNIRSINAIFDPAKKDSPNLLAGGTGAAVLGGGLLATPEEAEAGVITKGGRRMMPQEEVYARMHEHPSMADMDRPINPLTGQPLPPEPEQYLPPKPMSYDHATPMEQDYGRARAELNAIPDDYIPGDTGTINREYRTGHAPTPTLGAIADTLYGFDKRLGGLGDWLPVEGLANLFSKWSQGAAPNKWDYLEAMP